MFMRNVVLCAVIGLGSAAMPAAAEVSISINLGVAPPAPRYEVVPAPRAGYAWAPGYWHWENERHVWSQGRWIAARNILAAWCITLPVAALVAAVCYRCL